MGRTKGPSRAEQVDPARQRSPRLEPWVCHGAIKNIQQRRYAGRFLDVDLNNPDFLQLAAAFGVPAARSLDAEGLSRSLREALARQGPSLIEVPDRWRSHRE